MSVLPGRAHQRGVQRVAFRRNDVRSRQCPTEYSLRIPSQVEDLCESPRGSLMSADSSNAGSEPTRRPRPSSYALPFCETMRSDAFRPRHGQAKARRCAIVENIQGVARQGQRIGERLEGSREGIEGILVAALLGNFGEPEARQIGCDHTVAIRQTRHQFPILKGGRRKSVQQEHNRSIHGAGFPIEDRHPISRD